MAAHARDGRLPASLRDRHCLRSARTTAALTPLIERSSAIRSVPDQGSIHDPRQGAHPVRITLSGTAARDDFPSFQTSRPPNFMHPFDSTALPGFNATTRALTSALGAASSALLQLLRESRPQCHFTRLRGLRHQPHGPNPRMLKPNRSVTGLRSRGYGLRLP